MDFNPRAHCHFAQYQDCLPAILASHRQSIITNRPHQHNAMSSELEEELGCHDSLLEYINSMLMDETFEDSSWLQLLANANGGSVTDRSDGFDDISSKNLSSSLSPLNDRYQHIFKGFHEILDGQPSMLDHSPSFPLFVNGDRASYGLEGEGLWSDWKQAIPEGFHLQQPEDGDVDAFMYNPASAYTEGFHQQQPEEDGDVDAFMYNPATISSSMISHDKAKVRAANALLEQHNAHGQHTDLPIIMEALPNGYTEGRAVDAGAGHFHAHVNRVGSSLSGHLPAEEVVSLVRNADLPAELYAQLFDEWPRRRSKASAFSGAGGASAHPKTHPKSDSKEDAALANPIDLKGLLLSSAKAAGEGNVKRAKEMLQEVQQQGASPHGSGLQRVVHYFCEALVARLSGMGSTLYKAIANTAQLPSPMMMLKAYKMLFEVCPYVKIGYHFANQYILKVASGASRLHIVDYGILYGFQWPCLIYALAHRREGPPFIRITGIEFPPNSNDSNPTATTVGTSHRLTEYAKTYNVPFQYHAISASKWEDIDPSSLHILQDEVLVLNSFNRLGHLHDESMAHPSPRDQLLKRMRSLNPRLLVIGSVNATHSSPFFAPRFREAFHYYYNMFDVLHTTLSSDSPERVMFERELMGRNILNVVACEGTERAEIPENYKQWQARIKRAGFRQRPIIPSVMSMAQNVMKSYHKDFSLLQDSNAWILVGWRGRSMQTLSAWEPI